MRPAAILISTVVATMLSIATSTADVPKEPMSNTFIVIMPSAYDPAIVSSDLSSEWVAFFHFKEKANSSGEQYFDRYGRTTLYETNYKLALSANDSGTLAFVENSVD